jgi:arylsulfatase A-like enzyme
MMTCLADAGYRTHGVGKFHFHRRPHGFMHQELMEECIDQLTDDDYLQHLQAAGIPTRYPQGHRDLLYYQPQTCTIPEAHSQNRWVADRSNVFLDEHARFRRDQPFFLWSSWIAPHPPFAPVEPYDTMYEPAEIPQPIFTDRPIESLPAPTWAHRGRLEGAHHDPDRMARIKALYYGQVSHVDAAISSVLETLDRLGLAENTLVIFCSDHGEMLGDHGLSQKNTPYEASIRVPLILRWPNRIGAGRTCSDLVGLTDILPTLLDASGAAYPADLPPLPGNSLLERDGGGLSEARQWFAIDFGHDNQRWVCLRSAEKKYVYWASGGVEEAYDLASDPEERANLADVSDPPAWVAQARNAAIAWEKEYGLPDRSLIQGRWRYWPAPVPIDEPFGLVTINDGNWPENLPKDYPKPVQSFADAFNQAIRKETTLSPEKLSINAYLAQGGSLDGTVWEHAASDPLL